MSATAIASPAPLARAPAASRARPDPRAATSNPVGAHRHRAQPLATGPPSRATRFFGGDASPAMALASSMGRARRRSRGRNVRPSPCRALASPNDLGDVAGTLGLSLSGFEQVMGKASFGALLGASGVYCYKVSVVVRARVGARIAARETGASARGPSPGRPRRQNALTLIPQFVGRIDRSNRREKFDPTDPSSTVPPLQAFFTDEKRAGKPEQYAMLAGNLTLASLLAARWVESGHFPLSNMYESLLFLAWGVTGVHLVVTERDGYSKSAVPGALAAPTALMVVAGATLALPPELQRASALVPALKSNWLMMHVSVMMLSYATLLVGSLSCVSFLLVDATQGFEGAKGALGFLDGLVQKESVDAAGDAALAATIASEDAESEGKVRRRNRPRVGVDGTVAAVIDAGEFSDDASPVLAGADLMREMDNLAYRCLGAGFALLTAGLISGAVWANEAWGSYWSWDPKETWALITWLVYATYLHSRLVAGKSKKEVATVGALGFIVVWVCYVGVNLWGVGLHSYGWFANK